MTSVGSGAPPGLRFFSASVPGVALGLRPALHPWLPADAAPRLKNSRKLRPHPDRPPKTIPRIVLNKCPLITHIRNRGEFAHFFGAQTSAFLSTANTTKCGLRSRVLPGVYPNRASGPLPVV